MHTLKITAKIVALIALTLLAGLYFYFTFLFTEPVFVSPTETLEKVTIQPAEALLLAEPYLADHDPNIFYAGEPVQTHMVKYKDWYYITKTNYPAKNAGYYMQSAVKVNAMTGEIDATEKK